MKKLVIIVLLSYFFSGCMLKSVKDSHADNIHRVSIYDYNGLQYLICLESVFQATSKKSGQGPTIISGYNDMRISVYDICNGSLVVRKGTGKQIKNGIDFLGCSEGNLWFYSLDEGIHSLDPTTLDMKVSQEMIFEKNPGLKDNLALTEWFKINNFFQFDELKGILVISDKQGYRYELDPETLIAQKMPGDYTMHYVRNDDPFDTYISFSGMNLSLKGDLRKYITIENKKTDSTLSFLEGQFITDLNLKSIYNTINRRFRIVNDQSSTLQAMIDTIKVQNNGREPSWGTAQYEWHQTLCDSLYQLSNEKQNLESTIRNIEKDGWASSYKQLLSPDSNSFFIFHKTTTAKDANVIISRVQMTGKKGIKEIWQTTLPDLFYDPGSAAETDKFKIVFSKGNPDFSYSKIVLNGDRLIIIWMLNVHCIDIKTGKVLWKFRV